MHSYEYITGVKLFNSSSPGGLINSTRVHHTTYTPFFEIAVAFDLRFDYSIVNTRNLIRRRLAL